MRPLRVLLVVVAAAGVSLSAAAQSKASVEMRLRALESRLPDADRMAALEKSLGSQGTGLLANDLEQLRTEVRELRGLIEQLAHEVRQQQSSQQKLYGDLDRRLQALESRPSAQLGDSSTLASAVAVSTATSSTIGAGRLDVPAGGGGGQEQTEYLAAFELLQQGRTADSISAFTAFLSRYPGSSYAANAYYWLGEAHYVSKAYEQSLAAFQTLAAQYPDSAKISGAQLKIGYIHYETRSFAQARAMLEKVRDSYPNTSVSTLASERLERMRKEGV